MSLMENVRLNEQRAFWEDDFLQSGECDDRGVQQRQRAREVRHELHALAEALPSATVTLRISLRL